MGVGAGLYMYDVVRTFAISSPDEFLFIFIAKILKIPYSCNAINLPRTSESIFDVTSFV